VSALETKSAELTSNVHLTANVVTKNVRDNAFMATEALSLTRFSLVHTPNISALVFQKLKTQLNAQQQSGALKLTQRFSMESGKLSWDSTRIMTVSHAKIF